MDVEIKYDDREVQRALNRLIAAGGDLTPAMREIAGHLADSVADSFDRERAPDGAPWKPIKEKTKRDRRRQGGFPAHAGMDPNHSAREPEPAGLPRTRGNRRSSAQRRPRSPDGSVQFSIAKSVQFSVAIDTGSIQGSASSSPTPSCPPCRTRPRYGSSPSWSRAKCTTAGRSTTRATVPRSAAAERWSSRRKTPSACWRGRSFHRRTPKTRQPSPGLLALPAEGTPPVRGESLLSTPRRDRPCTEQAD